MFINPTTKRRFKAQLFAEFARIGKAFASPHRLQLIEILAQGERTVEQLAEDVGVPVANVSQHLQVLRAACLVAVRRDGLYARYSLADSRVFRVWQTMRDLGQARLSAIEAVVADYLGNRNVLDGIDATELCRRLKRGGVTLLDVRTPTEYEAGHIRGARNIPIGELRVRLRELPPNLEVVAYCRGPFCVFADEAVALLGAKGYRVRRLTEGYPDWRSRGYPSARGADAHTK